LNDLERRRASKIAARGGVVIEVCNLQQQHD
jgi:hypothetical protein